MGDAKTDDLRVDFASREKLRFVGSKVTRDASLIAYRSQDEVLGLTEMGADVLNRFTSGEPQAVPPRAAVSEVDSIADWPGTRMLTTPSGWQSIRLCVTCLGNSELTGQTSDLFQRGCRLKTELLSTKRNLSVLVKFPGEWIDKVHKRLPLVELILDMESSVSKTYGEQEGTGYGGHFECVCYHSLFLFNQFGDLESAMLRRGNKASVKFWRRVLPPVIESYNHLDIPKFFRGDAATGKRRLPVRHPN